MSKEPFQIRDLADALRPPLAGKQSLVLCDDEHAKSVLFAFATDEGLKEHVAPFPATIQIIQGNADLTVGDQAVSAKPGTWVRMDAKTPHSIRATTPLVMLLTLLK